MKLVFKDIENNEELDRLSQEIISDIAKNPVIKTAYPDVIHPSFLLSNFNARDDSKTIAAFRNRQLVGLASFVWSKQTFLLHHWLVFFRF